MSSGELTPRPNWGTLKGVLAVILAAGRGERLRPLTDTCSKPMVSVAGKPMVERVLEQLSAGGAGRFIVVAHPSDGPLLRLMSRPLWKERVRVVLQEERRGSADALQRAAEWVRRGGGEEFLLSSCDNIFPEGHVAALVAFRRAHRLDAALTLLRVHPEEARRVAVVRMVGNRVVGIVEKPRPEEAPSDLGSVSLYALTPKVLDLLPRVPVSPRGEREFPEALRLLIEEGGTVGGLVVAWRMTLTEPRDLETLERYFGGGSSSI